MTSAIPKVDEKTKWGDIEETPDEPSESIDENGIKTVIEYKTNEKGQKVKVTKKIRVIKTVTRRNKKVEERKKWKKFGECAGAGAGPESGITSVGDEVQLNLSLGGQQQVEEQKPAVNLLPANIVCRTCKKVGDHYTLKCPYKHLAETGGIPKGDEPTEGEGATPAKSVYVIPKLRGGGSADDEGSRRDEGATVRVTNLSEDTKESDLQELFRPFGPISRVYLAKDKLTNLSRGFAFINFVHREDAAKAIEKLSGFGYDHLILHLEWAKPSK